MENITLAQTESGHRRPSFALLVNRASVSVMGSAARGWGGAGCWSLVPGHSALAWPEGAGRMCLFGGGGHQSLWQGHGPRRLQLPFPGTDRGGKWKPPLSKSAPGPATPSATPTQPCPHPTPPRVPEVSLDEGVRPFLAALPSQLKGGGSGDAKYCAVLITAAALTCCDLF